MRRNQIKPILLTEYVPKPKLVLEEHTPQRAKFPVIDVHNHIGRRGEEWAVRDVGKLVDDMDACNVKLIVNLSGGWGDILKENIDRYRSKYPDRFAVFANLDWSVVGEPNFGERLAEQLEESVMAGAQGLKIFKNLGLGVRDKDGKLLRADDERLKPLWQKAAELKVPVLYHIADPVAFFDPLDRFNERWEELVKHPNWHFYDRDYPSFMELMEQQVNLLKSNPQTTFISAHVASYAENLKWVGQLLEECPNLYVDISERIGELGRQPYTARKFFIRYSDRILFGIDTYPLPEWYRVYFRFLETDDEYFNYSLTDIPRQGRWMIYGIYLPDEVLSKVYHENAERIIPGVG
ncbi:TPA: amidohydrolase [Candidatus Poribacteria bacterium]|nr:amidohydrolase [Candidatus Poribacteria bacterium]HEX29663.1 amidohydrolase [Candidatus Poribacteria bacterium]